MEEIIYISNYSHKANLILRFISQLHKFVNFKFSEIQKKGDVLKITINKKGRFDPEIIRAHKLTCVIEDDLFRTIYEDGERVLWKPIKFYSSDSHSL